MVLPMSDNHVDPSGNTEAFRAFTKNTPEEPAASKNPLIIAGVVGAVVVVLALVLWLAL